MNIVLSVGLIAALFMVGIEVPSLQSVPSVVGIVEAGSRPRGGPEDRRPDRRGHRQADERWQEVAFEIMTAIDKPVASRSSATRTLRRQRHAQKRAERYDFGDRRHVPEAPAAHHPGDPGETGRRRRLQGRRRDPLGRRPRARLAVDFVTYIEGKPTESVRVEVRATASF